MISMTAKVLELVLAIGTAVGGTAIWHARQTPQVANARDLRQAGRKDMDLRGVNLQGADLGGVDVQSLFLHLQWTGRITITQELRPNTAIKSQTGKRVATYDIIADIRGAEGSHGPPTITASESSSHVEAHERCWSQTIDGKISPDRSRDRKPDRMMFETGPVDKDHYWFSVSLLSPDIPVKGRLNELCGGTGLDISREDQINVQTKPKMNSIAFTDKNSSGTVEDAEGNSNGEWKTTLSWNFTIKPVPYDPVSQTPPTTPSPPPTPSTSSPPPPSMCVDFMNDEELKKLYREAQAAE